MKPSRRSVVRVSCERRSASIGKGARLSRSCPERRTMAGEEWKWESAQAIPAVSATASRAGRPKPSSRRERSASNISSPPKQVGGARDIEKKTVRAVVFIPGRDGGRVARCPQRQAAQGGMVGRGIGRMHLQHAGLGPRVGHPIATHKPEGFGRCVQGSNARSTGGIDGEDKRPLRIDRLVRREAAPLGRAEAQDRPSRQPNRNDARHDHSISLNSTIIEQKENNEK